MKYKIIKRNIDNSIFIVEIITKKITINGNTKTTQIITETKMISESDIIKNIENKIYEYYTGADTNVVVVIIDNKKHIKTLKNKTDVDNIQKLPLFENNIR